MKAGVESKSTPLVLGLLLALGGGVGVATNTATATATVSSCDATTVAFLGWTATSRSGITTTTCWQRRSNLAAWQEKKKKKKRGFVEDHSFFHVRGGSSSDGSASSLQSIVAPQSSLVEATPSPESSAFSLSDADRWLSITGDNDNDDDNEDRNQDGKPCMFASSIPYMDTTFAKPRVLFVLGGPGAGKGTQCAKIVEHFGANHLSVGDLLRAERERGRAARESGLPQEDTSTADLIEECMVAGKIVPVEISLGLLRDAMLQTTETTPSSSSSSSSSVSNNGGGGGIFLVDGFPRNWDNLEGWMSFGMPQFTPVVGGLVYDCPMEELEKRILSRAETSGRSDDNVASARKRFATFQRDTMPIIQVLQQVGERKPLQLKWHRIRADQSPQEVWDTTRTLVEPFYHDYVLTASSQLMQAINSQDLLAYASLCDPAMLYGHQPHDRKPTLEEAFQENELVGQDASAGHQFSELSNASIHMPDGRTAVVEYDRSVYSSETTKLLTRVRETRVWSHQPTGWLCVHFYRVPLQ